jgi:hypothetical protein
MACLVAKYHLHDAQLVEAQKTLDAANWRKLIVNERIFIPEREIRVLPVVGRS